MTAPDKVIQSLKKVFFTGGNIYFLAVGAINIQVRSFLNILMYSSGNKTWVQTLRFQVFDSFNSDYEQKHFHWRPS